MSDLPLASEFPTRSRDDWLALVEQTLKGASIDTLVSRTADGIEIQPLYTEADASVVPAGMPAAPWRIAQAIADGDPKSANAAILAELEAGATGIVLRVASSPAAPGIQIWTLDHLAAALKDVRLDAIPLRLDAGGRGAELAVLLAAHVERAGLDATALTGSLGIDPLAALAEGGTSPAGLDDATALAAKAQAAAPNMQAMTVATQPYHLGGASEAQELAAALATGVAYLRGLEAAGMALDEAARSIRVVLTADADVFLTIAKFRAWRALMGRVLQACGLGGAPPPCDAETAARMLTRRDPWVNMLRATAATFAAATGGAETITVAPFTAALGQPDGFARRIARNAQVILQKESHIARVADAGAGAWYLEDLTARLAEAAWARFQEIEAAGSMGAALESGMVQNMIAETREARGRAIARRKQAVTGVSEFPNLAEKPVATKGKAAGTKVDTETAADWAGLLDLARAGKAPAFATTGGTTCEALATHRLAAPFEALRDAADAAPERPKIFLARLGTPSDFTARLTFARNLFEAGGIETLAGGDNDFDTSVTPIACICSSDKVYGEAGAAAAKALKAAGASRVYLAGRPDEALTAAGVDAYIYQGCDVVECLEDLHSHLGVT